MKQFKSIAERIEEIHDNLVTSILDNIRTETDTLFHYTSLEGAHGIISSGQLRFTNVLYLNDPTEIKNGLEIADRVFSKLIAKFRSEKAGVKVDVLAILLLMLKVGCALPINRDLVMQQLVSQLSPSISPAAKNLFDNIIAKFAWSFYIASLSEKGDDLRQWLPYADDARGIAVGFKGFKDGHYSITENPDIWLVKVCYSTNADKERYLEAFLEQSLALLDGNDTKPIDQFLIKITELLMVDLVACKSEHYRDEAEWRLFFIQNTFEAIENKNAKKPEFHLKNSILKPYHIENLATGAITELKLGPRCDDKLNPDAFRMLAYFKLGSIPEVKKSKVEYRG